MITDVVQTFLIAKLWFARMSGKKINISNKTRLKNLD